MSTDPPPPLAAAEEHVQTRHDRQRRGGHSSQEEDLPGVLRLGHHGPHAGGHQRHEEQHEPDGINSGANAASVEAGLSEQEPEVAALLLRLGDLGGQRSGQGSQPGLFFRFRLSVWGADPAEANVLRLGLGREKPQHEVGAQEDQREHQNDGGPFGQSRHEPGRVGQAGWFHR
ncbi:MAG: hypothetical protein ACYTG0_45290 [Planctomycetota bacterium]